MRIQVLVQTPGEGLARARQASVSTHSYPGLNQIVDGESKRDEKVGSLWRARAVLHNLLCGGEEVPPQVIMNNCGKPIRLYVCVVGSVRKLF